jgi:hypothetical protein
MQIPIDARLISEFRIGKSQGDSSAVLLLCRRHVLFGKQPGGLFPLKQRRGYVSDVSCERSQMI